MNFMGTSRMLSGIRSAASEMFLRPGSRPLSMQRGVCFADAAAPAAVIPRPPFLKDMAEALKTAPTDPVLGRDDVIQEIVSALGKEEASSVILTGISGVGKTVLMYEVARLIMRGDLPRFEGYQLFIIEAEKFAAGGMPEGQVVALKNFIANYPGKVLLFVDEIQRLFSMSGATGPVMDSIKEDMARNLCTLFGTATVKDFDKSTRFDSALFRRLNVIELPPLSADITQDILCSKAPLLEQTYNTRGKRLFRIPEEVLELLVRLAGHYIKDRAFPDKALKTLESAVSSRDTALETSKARLKNVVQTLQLEINRTLRAIRDQSDENIVQAKNRLVELCAEYYSLVQKIISLGEEKEVVLSADDVYVAVAILAKVPVSKMKADEMEKLRNLEKLLDQRIIGQAAAKKIVSAAIRRSRTEFRRPDRPQGIFFWTGPSGVGKTALAISINAILNDDPAALLRFDMSEFREEHAAMRLVGAPPSYIGHDAGGQLTKAVKARPNAVILLDEIEKAHPSIWDYFLQVFSAGRLTDGKGNTVDFTNTIIVMTSNLAAIEIRAATEGMADAAKVRRISREIFEEALKGNFRPEFIGRIDEVVIFDALTPDEQRRVLDLQIAAQALKAQSFQLQVSEAAKAAIFSAGFSPDFGARPLDRALERLIVNPIVDMQLTNQIPHRGIVEARVVDGEVVLEVIGTQPKPEFVFPQVEGKVGALVQRVLVAVDELSEQRLVQITDDQLLELIKPKSERVDASLNAVLGAGLLPTGRALLEEKNLNRKDPQAEKIRLAVQEMAKKAGFSDEVVRAAGDFVYYLNPLARQAVRETAMTQTVNAELAYNFDGDQLTIRIATPVLPARSPIRERLQANLVEPMPLTSAEARYAYEQLGENGDFFLIDLKRAALAGGVKVGMGDAEAKRRGEYPRTVVYFQVKLFADAAAAVKAAAAVPAARPEVAPSIRVEPQAEDDGALELDVEVVAPVTPTAQRAYPLTTENEEPVTLDVPALVQELESGPLTPERFYQLAADIRAEDGDKTVRLLAQIIQNTRGNSVSARITALGLYVEARGPAAAQMSIGAFMANNTPPLTVGNIFSLVAKAPQLTALANGIIVAVFNEMYQALTAAPADKRWVPTSDIPSLTLGMMRECINRPPLLNTFLRSLTEIRSLVAFESLMEKKECALFKAVATGFVAQLGRGTDEQAVQIAARWLLNPGNKFLFDLTAAQFEQGENMIAGMAGVVGQIGADIRVADLIRRQTIPPEPFMAPIRRNALGRGMVEPEKVFFDAFQLFSFWVDDDGKPQLVFTNGMVAEAAKRLTEVLNLADPATKLELRKQLAATVREHLEGWIEALPAISDKGAEDLARADIMARLKYLMEFLQRADEQEFTRFDLKAQRDLLGIIMRYSRDKNREKALEVAYGMAGRIRELLKTVSAQSKRGTGR